MVQLNPRALRARTVPTHRGSPARSRSSRSRPACSSSPIAGALLDRHGRVKLMVVDYVVAGLALALIVGLGAADVLSEVLLLAIVTVMSLTFPLSTTGVRTMFPLIVPRPLWERANAVDSNGYVVSSILVPRSPVRSSRRSAASGRSP